MPFFIFYFTSILSVLIHAQPHFKKCYYATPNKFAGNYKYETGIADVTPFHSSNFYSKEKCNSYCRINDICYATSFINHNCSFYNTTNFNVVSGSEIQYSKWIICDTLNGYQPPDGRCEGFWVTYINKFVSVTSYSYLDKIIDDIWNCRKICLENPLCGFVNLLKDKCIFVPKWPLKNIIINDMDYSEMHKWTCVDNFINKIQLQRKTFKPIERKCTGLWEVSTRNFSVPPNQSYGLYFQTQIFKHCLEECNQYSNCFTVWYSVEYSFCILKEIEKSNYLLPSKNMSFIGFEYKCVKNDSQIPVLNDDEKRYQNLKMNCFKIVDIKNLFIAKNDCGKFPPLSKFFECFSVKHQSWNITDSCLVRQAYWAFPEESVKKNISGKIVTRIMKIYTGLQLYWLAYSGNNLKQVPYLECRHFNASRSFEKLNKDEIISKKDWQALPPNGNINSFQKKPRYFAISAFQEPPNSCKTRPACTDILRTLQVFVFRGSSLTSHFSDIPFNFMIDESGHIYECRGWHLQSAAVASYNSDTISIGYIGSFKYKLPNENVLNSIKKLIEYAVQNEFINSNYNLYLQQDLGTTEVHENIVIVIKNYFKYKGFIPDDCRNISKLIIGINMLILLVWMSLIYLFYVMFTYKMACNKCKFLCPNIEWYQIFPQSTNTSNSGELDNIYKNSRENYIIHEKSTINSPKNYIEIVKLIKLWIFNQILEAMNSKYDGNNLSHYLNCLSHIKSESIVYETEDSIVSKVILCVSCDRSFHFFKSLVKNKSCICHYFQIEKINITKMFTHIQVME